MRRYPQHLVERLDAIDLQRQRVIAEPPRGDLADHHLLEYSVTIDKGEIYSARFAMIYAGDMRTRIERILDSSGR